MPATFSRDFLPLAALLVVSPDRPAHTLGGYARQRLQTKVRETLRPAGTRADQETEAARVAFHGWRWLLGIGVAVALVLLVAIPALVAPSGVVVQVAVLDLGGAVRGGDSTDLETIRAMWPSVSTTVLEAREALQAWQDSPPNAKRRPVVRVLYDRVAAEVAVSITTGTAQTNRTFVIEQSLELTLREAQGFIESVTSRQ